MSVLHPVIEPLGDRAFMASFPDTSDTPACISGFCAALREHPAIQDVVPAFLRVCVHYDPLSLLVHGLDPLAWMQSFAALAYQPQARAAVAQHRVPVCYDPLLAPDLSTLSSRLEISVEAIIALHQSVEYRVGMIGFAPGFPYLTGLPVPLRIPRRSSPRTQVPAGSVAIAEHMCGIYPRALPGGWHLIGRTPLTLFDATRESPCLFNTGDRVCFYTITSAQFEAWPC